VHYSNVDLNKNEAIYEENRGKSGIYRWEKNKVI
jgi:hypothetical protein